MALTGIDHGLNRERHAGLQHITRVGLTIV